MPDDNTPDAKRIRYLADLRTEYKEQIDKSTARLGRQIKAEWNRRVVTAAKIFLIQLMDATTASTIKKINSPNPVDDYHLSLHHHNLFVDEVLLYDQFFLHVVLKKIKENMPRRWTFTYDVDSKPGPMGLSIRCTICGPPSTLEQDFFEKEFCVSGDDDKNAVDKSDEIVIKNLKKAVTYRNPFSEYEAEPDDDDEEEENVGDRFG